METKKQLYRETNILLSIWKQQRWENYEEIEPQGKEKAKQLFKIIEFKMPQKITYRFALTEEQYNHWRKIKPSFVKGK